MKCFNTSSDTLRLYINIRRMSTAFFVSVCFGYAETTETFFVRCGEDKPTPTPREGHPNDDGQRQDEQPTRTTHDERQTNEQQARNANRTANQRHDKHDKQNPSQQETTTDEQSERRTTRETKNEDEQTTQGTPPKKFNCLLAILKRYHRLGL